MYAVPVVASVGATQTLWPVLSGCGWIGRKTSQKWGNETFPGRDCDDANSMAFGRSTCVVALLATVRTFGRTLPVGKLTCCGTYVATALVLSTVETVPYGITIGSLYWRRSTARRAGPGIGLTIEPLEVLPSNEVRPVLKSA